PTQLSAGSLSVSFPQIAAGAANTALVVWAEGTSVRGRVWSVATNTFVPENDDVNIATQADGSRPRVAGNASGWVVAYAAGGNVNVKTVKLVEIGGEPDVVVGTEQRVNIASGAHDQPDVAMLPDGQFAVVWRNGEKVLVQRFTAAGDPITGDQDQPATNASPPAETPRIAASLDTGSFYAAGWATPSTGEVWGRMIDASGALFLRNHVNGLLSDFL